MEGISGKSRLAGRTGQDAASDLAKATVTDIDRTPVDTKLADTQWDAYPKALESNGWTTREVTFADKLADSVLVEDTLVVVDPVAIVTHSRVSSRRDEAEAAEEAAESLGPRIEGIMAPGTLDGGDVLIVVDRIHVDYGGRTSAEGVRQLREIATRQGSTVTAVPVSQKRFTSRRQQRPSPTGPSSVTPTSSMTLLSSHTSLLYRRKPAPTLSRCPLPTQC